MNRPSYIVSDVPLPPIPAELMERAHSLESQLNRPGNLLDQLALVFGFMDAFEEKYVAGLVTCSKGCSHCCRMDTQITSLEAAYIAEHVGVSVDSGRTLTKGYRTTCPFLSRGACSIYAHRPMVCRMLHALGRPKDCQPGRRQSYYGAPPLFGNNYYRTLVEWTHVMTQQSGGTLRDIRDFFPTAPVVSQQPKSPA